MIYTDFLKERSKEQIGMDIYFTPEWGEVNKLIEPGEPFQYVFESKTGCIKNLIIKREIPRLVDGEQYYDIVTPYGYGGPYIESCVEGKKDQLLEEYKVNFGRYCNANKIVSEFVRFHPIINNGRDFSRIYEAQCIRQTVGTNLESDDPVANEFSKSARKYVRRAVRDGVIWRVTEGPRDVSQFVDIYYSTMDRDNATDYYYFPLEYFNKCLELFRDHILFVEAIFHEKTIAAGFYLCYGDTIHAHLSGTLKEYLHLSPAYIIKYATAMWGKENGYKRIHYGGGTSNSLEDPLFLFKSKFTKNTFYDFYVGRVVWNQPVYDRLVEMTGKYDTEFFPKYRG